LADFELNCVRCLPTLTAAAALSQKQSEPFKNRQGVANRALCQAKIGGNLGLTLDANAIAVR
jgi:hypothetical protein